jgi:hypothetical protein
VSVVVRSYRRKQPGAGDDTAMADDVLLSVEIVKKIRLDNAHRLLDAND